MALLAAAWAAPAGAQQDTADPGGVGGRGGCPPGQQRGPNAACISEDTGSTGVPATAGAGEAGGPAVPGGSSTTGATSKAVVGTERGGVPR